jgi:hypothetical protein
MPSAITQTIPLRPRDDIATALSHTNGRKVIWISSSFALPDASRPRSAELIIEKQPQQAKSSKNLNILAKSSFSPPDDFAISA